MIASISYMRTLSIGFAAVGAFGASGLVLPQGNGDCRLQVTRLPPVDFYLGECTGDCVGYPSPYAFCVVLTKTDDVSFKSYECVCANSATAPTGHVQASKVCTGKLTVNLDGSSPVIKCLMENPDKCPAGTEPPKKCKELDPIPLGTTDACSCVNA